MSGQVRILVGSKGETKMEGIGFTGDSCSTVMNRLAQYIGRVEATEAHVELAEQEQHIELDNG